MAATYSTVRVCPYHGRPILLADCPIVVTSDEAESELSRLDDDPSSSYSFPGDPLHGRDGRVRRVVARPPAAPRVEERGRIRSYFFGASQDALLPSPEELTIGVPVHGLAPRRACPVCGIPLPDLIDDRDVFTIVVAGVMEASKSTMLARLCRLTGRNGGYAGLGFSEFVEMESSPDTLDILEERVLNGERLSTTPVVVEGAYEPWIFRVTGARSRQERLLFLHDIAGETFQDANARGRQVPFLGWADAVIFLVDPRPYMGLAVGGSNQARVLEGTLRSVRNRTAQVAVALAKADLLNIQLNGNVGDNEMAKATLRDIGASAIVDAASTRPGTTFHLLAAQPELGDTEAAGVTEVFAAVAARCGLI
jgi:Double-GTPase 2